MPSVGGASRATDFKVVQASSLYSEIENTGWKPVLPILVDELRPV